MNVAEAFPKLSAFAERFRAQPQLAGCVLDLFFLL
jgi:hypothetical protein